jgi:MYXO-CTERM domain-containing protein
MMIRVQLVVLVAVALLLGPVPSARAELRSNPLEVEDVSSLTGTPAGMTTLRFYARFDHADDTFLNVGWSNGTSIGGVPIFNATAGRDTAARSTDFAAAADLAWDSWVSAGVADALAGDDTSFDPDWGASGFDGGTGVAGGWYDGDPATAARPDASGRFLLAQLTFQAAADRPGGVGMQGPLTLFYRSGATGHLVRAEVAWAGILPGDAVELLELSASRSADGVSLRWVTGVELRCGAFEVRRCLGGDGAACVASAHTPIEAIGRIPCRGGLEGAVYTARDGAAPATGDLSYVLREYETRGGTRDYGPLRLPDGALSARWDPESGRSFSEPGRATPVDRPRPSIGCAAGSAPAPPAWLPLGLLAVVLGARRRRRTAATALVLALCLAWSPSARAGCLGDLDGDGDVDPADLARLLDAWGPCAAAACSGDLSGDASVGKPDLDILIAGWGPASTCPPLADHCAAGSHDCAATALCVPAAGSFTCQCPSGAHGDGRFGGTGCTGRRQQGGLVSVGGTSAHSSSPTGKRVVGAAGAQGAAGTSQGATLRVQGGLRAVLAP